LHSKYFAKRSLNYDQYLMQENHKLG
jgi:hypothetical protein